MATVLITGANRGIGLAMTAQLAAKEHRVLAVCRRASSALTELKCEIYEGVDLTDLATVQTLRLRLQGTTLDWLINNAGVLHNEELGHLNWKKIEEQWQVNTLGPLRVVETLQDILRPGSKVAMVTSRMGSLADNTSGGYYGYRMSKAALNMASVSLARDLLKRGIAVGVFHPGYVQTDMTDHHGDITPDEAARGLIALIEGLTLKESGGFWHANGSRLPW